MNTGGITMHYFARKLGKERSRGTNAVVADEEGYSVDTAEGTVITQYEDGLIALEGHVDESAALSLLARHYVDREAAFLTFGDPTRLQRDALGDAGAEYLHHLLPQPVEGMCSVLERTETQVRHVPSSDNLYCSGMHSIDMKV